MPARPTALQDLLGIELPIVQAPMAGVQGSALTVAVSNAGGLGSLPCAMLDVDTVRAELAVIRAGTTRPFNLNFFCHRQPEPNPEQERAWQAALSPYFAEHGINASAIAAGSGRLPFGAQMAALLEELKPPVVSFHFGLPTDDLLARVRQCGARILSSATTVDEARWLEARGVDAIVAQGVEAGGHRGLFLSDDLTTQRHPRARTADRASRARAGPARGIVNRLVRELGPISAVAPQFPLAASAIAPLRAKAESLGSSDFSPLWAGQNVSGCLDVPAARLTRELAAPRYFRRRVMLFTISAS